MSTVTTNSNQTASVNPVEDIAKLLVGESQTEGDDGNQEVDDADGSAESESETSTDEGQNSESENENTEGEEEPSSGTSDEDVSWSGVLGVGDDAVVLDDEGNLQGLVVKVDGITSTVSVKDLIAGYQTNKHYTQKSQILAEERKEFEKARGEVTQSYTEKLGAVEKLTEFLYTAMTKEFQQINWERLRVENPGEYAAAIADYQTRDAQFKQIISAVNAENVQLTQQQQKEQETLYQKHLANQYEKVLVNNPSWHDHKKMQIELQNLAISSAENYGITDEEFAQLNDARYLEILKDAIAFRKGKTVTENKLKSIPPKFQKANGGKPSKPMSKLTRLTLDARKASGSKKRDLQTDAVAELLMGQR